MANVFDQFDQPKGNPFDQFDEIPETQRAVLGMTQDDPYFLPIEDGQAVSVPEAPGGKKGLDEFTAPETAIGAIESGLSAITGGTTGMATGAAGGLVGMIGDLANILTPEEAQELQQRWATYGTYQPKTEAGIRQVEEIGAITGTLPPIMGSTTPRVRIGKESRPRLVSDQVRRAEQFAEDKGAPLMATDIDQPSTFSGKAIRGAAEKVPVVGTGGKRAEQQDARHRFTGDYIESFDQVTDLDLYNDLLRGNKRDQAMANRYNEIGKQMGYTVVTPSKTISVIDSELENLTKRGKVQSPEVINKLETLREQLSSGEVDYQGMRNNRTLMRETLKSEESKTLSDRVINRVYSGMTEDIQDAVTRNLGNEAARKLKQVDRATYDKYNETKKTKLKNVLNKGDVKPEEVTKMLLSNDKSEVSKLYKALDNSGRSNARSLIIGELRKVFDETNSPERVMQRARKLGNQFEMFFKGSQKDDYLNLASYLKQTKQAANSGVYNQNGQQLMAAITMAPVADIAGAGGVATGAAATIGLAGRVLESRRVRSALRRLKGIKPYTPEYNQALIALDNAVNEVSGDN